MTANATPAARLTLAMLGLTPAAFALASAPVGTLLPLAAVAWLLAARAVVRPSRWLRDHWVGLMLATVVLGLASAGWALDARLAASKAALFGATVLPLSLVALELPPACVKRCRRWLLGGLVVGLILLAVQIHGSFLLRALVLGTSRLHPEYQLNVPAAGLAVACWLAPLACAGLGRKWHAVAGAVVLGAGWAALAGNGSAPALGWLVACVVLLAARWMPRLVAGLLATGLLLAQFAVPHLAENTFMQSHISDRNSRIRMDIWQLSDRLSQERPLLGYGFSNSREIPPLPYRMPLTNKPAKLPLYPHSVLMEARLELGIPGVLLLHACWWVLLWRALRLPPWARATAMALLASSMAIWCVGYPLWRSAWLAWLCYIALGFVSVLRSTPAATDDSQAAKRAPTTGIA